MVKTPNRFILHGSVLFSASCLQLFTCWNCVPYNTVKFFCMPKKAKGKKTALKAKKVAVTAEREVNEEQENVYTISFSFFKK